MVLNESFRVFFVFLSLSYVLARRDVRNRDHPTYDPILGGNEADTNLFTTADSTTYNISEQELRNKCCKESDYQSYCTSNKCYFLTKDPATFLDSRNQCRKDYVRWEYLVDAAAFEDEKELEQVKDFLFDKGRFWIGGTCCLCPMVSPLHSTEPRFTPTTKPSADMSCYNWLNGITIDWISPVHSAGPVKSCMFATLEGKNGRIHFEEESKSHQMLCELTISDTLDPTVTTTSYRSTIESSTSTRKRHETGCEGRIHEGIEWPRTPFGMNATADCPPGTKGVATWECDEKTGEFVQEPDMMRCRSEWFKEIEDEISEGRDPSDIANKLSQEIREKELKYGDLLGIVNAMQSLNHRFDRRPDVGHRRTYGNASIQIGSELLDKRRSSSWEKLRKRRRVGTASKLLLQIQTVGRMLSCKDHSTEENILSNNILLQSFVLEDESPQVFPREPKGRNFLRVPSDSSVKHSFQTCTSQPTGYGILYERMGSYLVDHQNLNRRIISKLISFAFGGGNSSIILPPGKEVLISLEHTAVGENEESVCVFWNFEELRWDKSGCWKTGGNSTYTECKCSHLTNFAVLMDLSGDIRTVDDPVMKYLSIVCCALSSVALSITMACLIGFRASHSRRSTITCNLSFCLLAVNLLVLFGINKTENEVACRIIAALLHYSALAAFCWMLLEGYHVYQMVIVVFERINTIKLRWFCISAYAFPLLIVLPAAIIRPESYGDKSVCWLTAGDNMIWTFGGPVAGVLLANSVILIMALHAAGKVKMKKQQTKAKNLLKWIKGSFSLMSLLGTTWIIGFINAYKGIPALGYAFIIFNGLQGCFVMIFHVIINEKVRGCFIAFIRRSAVSEMKFRKSMQTTASSHNPLYSGRSSESVKESQLYFPRPRRISVLPASTTYHGHM